MALLTDQLNTITQEEIRPMLIDNVFNSTPTLKYLKEKTKEYVGGGTYISQPIISAEKTSSGWYTGWNTLLTEDNDSITSVKYNWAHVYCSMSISKTDELKNAGKARVISLLTTQAKLAELTLAKKITTALFSTSSITDALQGFALMCDDSSSTEYAGIDSADVTTWAASKDTSTTVLTLGALNGKFGDVTDGSEMPNLIISAQDAQDKYWQLLETKPEFRVQDENGGLKFRGATWIVDKACTGTASTADNYIYFLNTNFIQLYLHPEDNFVTGPWQKPINQMGKISQISATLQLATSNRRRQGLMTTINPAL